MQVTGHSVLCKYGFTFLIIIFACGNIFPQKYPDPIVDSLISNGIKKIINQDYTGAKNTFLILEQKFPSLPAGRIFIAAADIARAVDYYENTENDSLIDKLGEIQKEAKTLYEKNPGNVWNLYFLALSEGYIAYYNGLNGNWLSAFNKGTSAISDFNECLKLKPDFYEAYTSIGTYKYWRSRKTEFLSWLPFVNNEEDEGIKELKLSIQHSSYHRYLAINSLIWIYIDRKQFSEAKALSEKALIEYPNVRLFKWALARSYEGIDQNKSIALYSEILDSYKSIKGLNRCNEITLKHIIAQLYNRLGNRQKALDECNEILAINNLSDFEKDKMDSRLNRVKKLKKELMKELTK